MKIVRTSAYARAGLLGNPSDGYFGKTISATLQDFSAKVVLYEWPELEIILSGEDRCQFGQMSELVEDVKINGLYGGLRLIKAAIKVFVEHCQNQGVELTKNNFSLRYETNIPRQVGLGGSSAIITAVFRALMEFYDVSIPRENLASLILKVETDEIGIIAGLQDRVCQTYGGLIYMDFEQTHMEKHGYGIYQKIDPSLLPPLYLAYRRNLSQISGIYHSNLRARWESGDTEVVQGIAELAELAELGKDSILKRNHSLLTDLINRNFDTRARLMALNPGGLEMIELARSLGVCAKYAGSGGAIVGICENDELLKQLRQQFAKLGCEVIRPTVQP